MISVREINVWRSCAPWLNDLMVEQDYLLCQAVAAIFEAPFLKSQLAMRGGTVLHKAHLAPASWTYQEGAPAAKMGVTCSTCGELGTHRQRRVPVFG